MGNLLNIGNTGLIASKQALETSGHNLANVNTKGYSRQRVVQETATPITKNGLIQGSGTTVKDIRRVHDTSIENRLRSSASNKFFYKNKAEQLDKIQSLISEIDKDGLNIVMNKFFNAFRELSSHPEDETMRSIVRDTAHIVTNDFNAMGHDLISFSKSIDKRIQNEVSDVNSILHNIAHLNKEIKSLEIAGTQTGDLRDRRDLAIQELSKSFKIKTYLDGDNNYIVNAVNVGTLVAGGTSQDLIASKMSKKLSSNGLDGAVEIFLKDRPNQQISLKFKKGSIASLFESRNKNLQKSKKEIDAVAFNFAKAVNAIHKRGFVNRHVKTINGKYQKEDNMGLVTGIKFFDVKEEHDASLNLKISKAVDSNLSNIITSFTANTPGNNQIALAISKLQNQNIMDNGRSTLQEEYLKVVGNVGIEAGKARLNLEQSNGIYAQVKSMRERTSGVSIDEETANMVKFQHAYQASAKVMKVAEEMFQTVLGIKR